MKEQLYLDKDMRPVDEPPEVPACRDAIYAWIDAKEEQRHASERAKAAADAALVVLAEHGLESHPYVDAITGKRKHFVRDTTPKPKTASWPKRQHEEEDVGEEVERPDPAKVFGNDDRVEMRRVSRASVEKEIDPFAATRASMDVAQQGPLASDTAKPTPSRGKGKRGK